MSITAYAFQSTLPRGERHDKFLARARGLLFQSTLPRGERRRQSGRARTRVGFNPRSRVGSDHGLLFYPVPPGMFQSTLPRGERPRTPNPDSTLFLVSIHAPAWGATCRAAGGGNRVSGFQSTLPRGERRLRVQRVIVSRCFNPRSRVGSDELRIKEGKPYLVSIHAPAWGATWPCRRAFSARSLVSIHAPAWGATAHPGPDVAHGGRFNPRSRVGSDGSDGFKSRYRHRFQSTLPRGERPLPRLSP